MAHHNEAVWVGHAEYGKEKKGWTCVIVNARIYLNKTPEWEKVYLLLVITLFQRLPY